MSRRLAGTLAALLLAWALPAGAADLQTLRGPGWSLELPAQWTQQKGLMGAELVARPPKSDAVGWAQDQLILTREPYDARRTCLDGFLLRKLRDMGHLAQDFQVVSEQPLELGGAVASRLELEYREGPRHLHAYLTVLATDKEMIVLSLTSEPARFEFQRALFRRIADSLRPATR